MSDDRLPRADPNLPPVRIGGLLRCCGFAIPDDPEPAEGEYRPCPHADDHAGSSLGNGVRFVNGAWQAAWIEHP